MGDKRQVLGARDQGSDEFNLSTMLGSIVDHKKLIASITAITFAIGCAYAFLSQPTYEATMLIKVADAADPAPASSKDYMMYLSRPLDEKSSTDREIQILGSRNIIAKAVSEEKLDIKATPRYFPLIGRTLARHADQLSTPGIAGFGGYVWGNESIKVGELVVPDKMLGENLVLRAKGNGRYVLTTSDTGESMTGTVGATEHFTTSKGEVTLLVSSLASNPGGEFVLSRQPEQLVVDDLQHAIKIWEQGNKTSLLRATLQGPDPHVLVRTLSDVAEQYQRWSAERRSEIAQASLSYLNVQLPDMRKQVEKAEARYNEFRNANAVLDVGEEGRILLKQFADANDQIVALKRKREDLSSIFSASHPSVVAIDRQIAATQQEVEKLNDRVKEMPAAEQGALGLLRDVRINTDLYTAMLNNAEEMRLISAGKASPVQLIDAPETPIKPVKPVKWRVLAASLGLGALLGMGWAILRDRLLRGVTDTEAIEAATGVSVFATIPHADNRDASGRRKPLIREPTLPLALSDPRDPAIEGLRMLRSALQFLVAGARNNVVMVSGPLPGIGKSFIAANLATVLAASGKRVLLIDGDMRKGKLREHFGLTGKPGLSDVLAHMRNLDDVIIRGVAPHLDLVQSGPYPTSPADLLSEPRFGETVELASSLYDIVLIDTPAILAVSDAGVMAPLAGSVLLVARYGDTLAGEIEASIKRLSQTGGRVNGILLNGVKVHNGKYALARRYGTLAYVDRDYPSRGR